MRLKHLVFATAAILAGAVTVAVSRQGSVSLSDFVTMAHRMDPAVKEHEALQRMAGEWIITGKAAVPGMPHIEFNGEATGTMVLDGRFLDLRTRTALEEPKPIESIAMVGFDTRNKHYTLWGADSFGTWTIDAAGTLTPEGAMKLSGVVKEGGMEMKYFQEFAQPDDESFSMRMVMDIPGSGPQEVYRLEFKRKK